MLRVFQLIMFHHLRDTVGVICKLHSILRHTHTHTERVVQLWALMLLPATSAQLAPLRIRLLSHFSEESGVEFALQMKGVAASVTGGVIIN